MYSLPTLEARSLCRVTLPLRLLRCFFFFSLYCMFLVVHGLLLWNLGSRACALFFSCDPRGLAACGMSPDQGPNRASRLNKADSFFKLIFKFLLHWGFMAAHRLSCPKAHCILVPQ